MVVRVGLKECRVDVLYLGTLLSSLVLLNTRVCLLLNSKSLSHNMLHMLYDVILPEPSCYGMLEH